MTEYIDRTQEPDEAFTAVLARFDAAPPTVEQMTGVLLTAILGDADGSLVLWGELHASEIARLIAEVAAPAALAVFRGQQDPAVQRVLALVEQAEDRIRHSTPPPTAERLIAEGSAPTVTTGELRAAIGGAE